MDPTSGIQHGDWRDHYYQDLTAEDPLLQTEIRESRDAGTIASQETQPRHKFWEGPRWKPDLFWTTFWRKWASECTTIGTAAFAKEAPDLYGKESTTGSL